MTLPLVLPKPKARQIVVAPRLPPRPKAHDGNPFTTEGFMVADCETRLPDGTTCGYHVAGPRADVKKALDLHHRTYHSEDIGVVLLNQARQ